MPKRKKQSQQQTEATIAPGMNLRRELERDATEEEIARGDFTPVTRLVLDRTPDS